MRMSVEDDVRKVFHDLVSPDLKAIAVRLESVVAIAEARQDRGRRDCPYVPL